MFAEMISEIASGIMPDSSLLRKRFDLALTKKLGVIKTPYSLWTTDKKINPSARDLLWAAIILEDRDSYMLVNSIIAVEIEERRKAAGEPHAPVPVPEIAATLIRELLQTAPSERFRQLLRQKVARTINRVDGMN